MDVIIDRKITSRDIMIVFLPRGEVVVSAGDKEAITCTDIGELLSSCHQ